MSTIASLLVRLAADFGDAPTKVRDLNSGMVQLGHSAEEAGQHVDQLGRHVHEAQDPMEGAKEALEEFGKEMLEFGVEALGIASAFEVLKESMEVSAEIESVTVALEAFTGSAEAAVEVVEQLEKLAKSEALNFPEVLPAAQHFMALGFSAEQTTRSIQVAGNAAWALGTSVESVTQRMGMMSMGGQVSARFLRSLGIGIEDLARVMGITGSSAADLEDKVRRAFKFENEEDRLHALQSAMEKFSGLGGKEAETMTGKWIEMKNAMHVAFATLGEDLTGAAKVVMDAVTGMIEAITGLLNVFDIVKGIKDQTGERKIKHIDDDTGHSTEILTMKDLSEGRTAVGRKDYGALAKDVLVPREHEGKSKLGANAADTEASEKALAESNAAQSFALRKTQIDSAAASAKSMVELWRSANATYLANGQMTYSEALANNKYFNEQELQITLDAINKKKALQTSTKGLKEEEKDATLDAQAESARNKSIEANTKLDNAELTRRHKFFESVVKESEAHAVKMHELNDKMIHGVESSAFDMRDVPKEVADTYLADRDKDARAREKSDISTAHDVATSDAQSNRVSQMEAQRAYGLEYTHTLAQQVAYQRQLGELEAAALGIKAQELAVTADASKADAARANAALDLSSTDEEVRAAADLTLKAHADDLKVMEALNAMGNARYDTETKILNLKKQQSVPGQLAAQISAVGQALPATLSGAIVGGLTHRGKGGADVGKEVADAMRNVGKQLFSEVLTSAIKQLVVSLGLNTIAQNLMHVLFGTTAPTQITATVANTAALAAAATATAANTAALAASSAASGAGAAAGAGGGAASVASNAASTAATGAVGSIIGPVIGGVISGVISAAATLIGDAAIVKAVNRTTAAVYSLRASSAASTGGTPGMASDQTPQAPTESSGFFANIASSLLNAFTAADAIPVKLMAINPGIIFASAASLFGFASGGPVPYDMVAKVHGGEHVLNEKQVQGLEPLPDLPAFAQYGGAEQQSGGGAIAAASSSGGVHLSGPMHFHGVQNVRHLMKEIAEVAKNASPGHSPLSSR